MFSLHAFYPAFWNTSPSLVNYSTFNHLSPMKIKAVKLLLWVCIFFGSISLSYGQDPFDYRLSIQTKLGLDIPVDPEFYRFDNKSLLGTSRISISPEVGIHYHVNSDFRVGVVFNYLQMGGLQSLDFNEVAEEFGLPRSAKLSGQLYAVEDTSYIVNGFNYMQAFVFGLSFYHRLPTFQTKLDKREAFIWPFVTGFAGFGMINRKQFLLSTNIIEGVEGPDIQERDLLGDPCSETDGNCPNYDFVLLDGARQWTTYVGGGVNFRLRNQLDLQAELGFMRFFESEGENGERYLSTNIVRGRVGIVYHLSQKNTIYTDPK